MCVCVRKQGVSTSLAEEISGGRHARDEAVKAHTLASDGNSKRRDYLLNTAMLRWQKLMQKQAMGHAWACWYEQRVQLVRLRNISTRIYKIASRWSKMQFAQAFGSWHNVSATKKQNSRKLQKVEARREKIKYATAFGSWHAQTKAQRKLRIAATRVVKRSANRALALAWGSWCGKWCLIKEVRRYRIARMATLKWTHKTICAAWARWWGEVRHSRVARKLSLKWMHKAICAAWTRWETPSIS